MSAPLTRYACPVHGHLCETSLKHPVILCGHKDGGKRCNRRARPYVGEWKPAEGKAA